MSFFVRESCPFLRLGHSIPFFSSKSCGFFSFLLLILLIIERDAFSSGCVSIFYSNYPTNNLLVKSLWLIVLISFVALLGEYVVSLVEFAYLSSLSLILLIRERYVRRRDCSKLLSSVPNSVFWQSGDFFREYIFPKFLLPDLWILKGLLGCLPFEKEAKRAEMASHRNSIWLSTQKTSLPS